MNDPVAEDSAYHQLYRIHQQCRTYIAAAHVGVNKRTGAILVLGTIAVDIEAFMRRYPSAYGSPLSLRNSDHRLSFPERPHA